MKPDTILKQNRDVLCTQLDDGKAVLLDLGTKYYYTLENEESSYLWNSLDQKKTIDQLAKLLLTRWLVICVHFSVYFSGNFFLTEEEDVSKETALENTMRFFSHLKKEGLVELAT